MRVLTNRAKHFAKLVVIIAGLMGLLVVPLSRGGASGPARTVGQNQSTSELGKARTRALRNLVSQLEGGSPFAEEEIAVLRRFNAGVRITELEADAVISRALYDFYVAGAELSRAQQQLLALYTEMVAPRGQDVADLKTRLLDRRKSAAADATRRISPLAVPSNDLCAGAEVVPSAGPFPYMTAVTADITDATTVGDPPPPSCQTNVSRSIWYSFTPSVTATYTISTCALDGTATTVDDTVMAIYTSSNGLCTGALTEVPKTDNTDGCGDDECIDEALQAVIRTQLNAATPYFIVVYEFDPTAPTAGNTAVQLKVSQNLPPANDTCAGGVALTLNTPVGGTLEFANDNYRATGACFTGVGSAASSAAGRDVVYSFTAPFADTYSIRVTGYVQSSLSNVVVYTAGSCPAAGGSPVTVSPCLSGSNRGVDTTAEEILCQPLASNQQIFIFVDENEFTSAGPFTIEVTRCARESGANDTPATASALRFGIEGSIDPGADVDFFSLGPPAAGSRVFALVDGVAANSSDFDIRVTTTTDTLEYDDSNADTPFGFISPSIAGTMLTGTASFIRLNHFAGTAAEPYRLYTVVQPPSSSATPESEPNDVIGTANSAANNYFSGSLSGPAPSTDQDLFSFAATAGDLIFLSLDADPLRDNTPINAALTLLGPGGVQLMSVNDGGTASSTSSGAGSLTSTTPSSPSEGLVLRAPTTGTYYARVTIGTTSATSVGAGDYLLSITRNGLTGSCTYSIAPTSQSFSGAGGPGMVAVTAGTGCAWTAVSDSPGFITITSGSSGTGNGTVNYSVGANSTCASRTGTITIAGQTFTVTQAAGICTFTLAPTSRSFTSSGGTDNVSVIASAPCCAWTAMSNDSWITITSGSSGTGSGTVGYSVGVNAGAARTGTMTIGGQTFTVNQSASLPPIYQGFLDAAGCGIITGWAWDANQPNTPINVDVFDASTLVATIPANLFREDIVNAGIGNGFHGFSFSVPASLKNGAPHTIRVTFSTTATELGNSPRSINCSGAPPIYQGFHDGAGCNTISGWAWDANDPNNPINVDIYDGTTLIATVPSIQFRPDLVTAGIGNGFHGFSYTVTSSLRDGQPHSIRVRFPGSATSLGNTPRTIQCNGALPIFEGIHEVANCNVISGWAWDRNDPISPINVAIFDGSQLVATVLAIQFRQDLVNAGIGNGYHAFTFNVPANLKDGQPHSIRVRYSGTTTSLGSTPRSITCPP